MKLAERTFNRLYSENRDDLETYYITSPFGYRNGVFHDGCDYGTHGQNWPQYALEKGVVIYADSIGNRYTAGKFIRIKYPRLNIELSYYHLDTVNVAKNQEVDENTIIGLTGMTGNATGVHLHLALRILPSITFVDPETYNYIPENHEPEPEPEPEPEIRYNYRRGEKPIIVRAGTVYYRDSYGYGPGKTQKKDYRTSIAIEYVNTARPKPINVYGNYGQYLGWIGRDDIK